MSMVDGVATPFNLPYSGTPLLASSSTSIEVFLQQNQSYTREVITCFWHHHLFVTPPSFNFAGTFYFTENKYS